MAVISPLYAPDWAEEDEEMHAVIGTWEMAKDGVSAAAAMLFRGETAEDAVVQAIRMVEDEPAYTSVGYGGLPNREGRVMLDAALMDGRTLRCGAVMSAEGIQNPILAARLLCGRETNSLLAGRGAEQFAVQSGLPMRDMRTPASLQRWREQVANTNDSQGSYRGHDTVCVLALDRTGHMVAGTSTSGLFMKEPGRVGDSPIIGSGFYCDERYGAAAATGLGEDIMRGCLSYEIVALMRAGSTAQEACDCALRRLVERKLELGEEKGEISVIALSPEGSYGAATTLPIFPFALGNGQGASLHAARCRTLFSTNDSKA